MIWHPWQTQLNHLWHELKLAVASAWNKSANAELDALAQHLRVLHPTPAPNLAYGRERVLSQARRLQNRRAIWNTPTRTIQSPSLIGATVGLVLLTITLASIAWTATDSSAPTIALTAGPETANAPAGTIFPTTSVSFSSSATIALTPQPAVVPEPTRQSTLISTRQIEP